jgi:hypothetical protein
MRTFLVTIAAAVAAAFPAAALADYTYVFQVPATATNIVSGSGIQAECSLYNGAGGSGGQLATNTSAPTQSLSPAGGAWNGTLTVKVTSSAKPASYKCWLLVWGPGNSLLNIVNGTPENAASGWTGTMYTAANLP